MGLRTGMGSSEQLDALYPPPPRLVLTQQREEAALSALGLAHAHDLLSERPLQIHEAEQTTTAFLGRVLLVLLGTKPVYAAELPSGPDADTVLRYLQALVQQDDDLFLATSTRVYGSREGYSSYWLGRFSTAESRLRQMREFLGVADADALLADRRLVVEFLCRRVWDGAASEDVMQGILYGYPPIDILEFEERADAGAAEPRLPRDVAGMGCDWVCFTPANCTDWQTHYADGMRAAKLLLGLARGLTERERVRVA